MYQTTTATTMTAAAIATTATVEAATITSAMYPPRLATETLKPRGNCHVRLSACSASSARLLEFALLDPQRLRELRFVRRLVFRFV